MDSSDSSQGKKEGQKPSLTGNQGRRPQSRQKRGKSLAIYKEMERQKEQFFKNADPKYQEDKGSASQGSEQVTSQKDNSKALKIPDYENEGRKEGEGVGQRTGSRDKYPEGTVELVSREGLRKRGAPSTGYPRQASPERGNQGREKARPISQPTTTNQIDQSWRDYKAKNLRTPCQSPHYRAKSDERRQPSQI